MLSTIIKTKLYRPLVPPDLVLRDRLLDYLEKNSQTSVTLVSAPAGYGKTTLLSHWLDVSKQKSTWLSLDEHDNDFRQFYSYIVAAIQVLFPGACRASLSMLTIDDFPSPEIAAKQLVEDLDEIGHRFVLVLDDFQAIHIEEISEFLIELLRLPLHLLHLVISSRRDPSLPIALLRSRGLLTDIRVWDLRFTLDETSQLITNITGITLEEQESAAIDQKTEGWVTGLRLTALTLRNRQNVLQTLSSIPDDNRYIMDYIVGEVVAKQPHEIQMCLLSVSILNRFCTSLCIAVCGKEFIVSSSSDNISFVEWLQQSNLFLIPLDSKNTWFRFHHLFRAQLLHQAMNHLSEDDMKLLNAKAGKWFADNNHVDEALYFLLKGGDTESAVEVFCAQRHACMNREQWRKLDQWMKKLPQDIVDTNPELLLSKAWHFDSGLQLAELRKYVEKAGEALSQESSGGAIISKTLMAEYNALTGFLHYLKGDGLSAVSYCQKALTDIDPSAYSVRGYATIILAGAYQMSGELDKAYSTIYDAFEENFKHGTTYHSRLFVSLCFTNWIAGDIKSLVQTSRELKKIGYEYNLPESISFGHYFLGVSYYSLNKLEEAKIEFQKIYGNPFYTNIWDYSHSAFGLSLVYMAEGQPGKAEAITEKVISLAFQKQNNDLLRLAKAFLVELALQRGDHAATKHWANTFQPKPFIPGYRSYAPQLTLARSLLSESTKESLENALHLLLELGEYYQSIHNTKFLVEVFLLQALVYQRNGNEEEAFCKYVEAVDIAEPGGLLRSFLDFGQEMEYLIFSLAKNHDLPSYTKKIRMAFDNNSKDLDNSRPDEKSIKSLPQPPESKVEHLTKRELELLAVLADGVSNDEIADKLFISTDTVKKHLFNIYRKLEVKNRQQAIIKANSIGFL